MSIEPGAHLHRTAHIAWIWRRIAGDPAPNEARPVDLLPLPLIALALSLLVLSLPGASDAIAEACAVACLP
jgi:hypothetical protein